MNFLLRVSLVFLLIFLDACRQEDPPTDAPTNLTPTPGESLVVLDWDVISGRSYWIFYQQGTNTDLEDFENILTPVTPPYIVTGLANGTQYAFSVTSSQNGSKVGPFSSVVTETPRLLSSAIAWTDGGSLTGSVEDLFSIAFGNNAYVTVGEAATLFVGPYNYTDTGGVTGWSQPTLPGSVTANLISVIYDGFRFVVLGVDGSITTSTDTETWEVATVVGGTPNMLAYGANVYVVVGNTGEIYTNTSSGVTAAWTSQTSGVGADLYGVSYVNGMFIVVGAGGILLTSPDGATWTQQTSNAGGNALRDVAYGAGVYVAVGDVDTIVSSTDATNWSLPHTAPITGESFRAIVFGPDEQFIAVGTAGALAYSVTGVDGTWDDGTAAAGVTEQLNSIASNFVFIAVGAIGVNVSGK
jgi:photosystem II stability/assembly factor-like uncharacterized protein